jgi:hypothetical protein
MACSTRYPPPSRYDVSIFFEFFNETLSMCVCVQQLELHGEAVQCGACEVFFHGECVGFQELADMPGEDDDWFCPACKPKPAPEPKTLPKPKRVRHCPAQY